MTSAQMDAQEAKMASVASMTQEFKLEAVDIGSYILVAIPKHEKPVYVESIKRHVVAETFWTATSRGFMRTMLQVDGHECSVKASITYKVPVIKADKTGPNAKPKAIAPSAMEQFMARLSK